MLNKEKSLETNFAEDPISCYIHTYFAKKMVAKNGAINQRLKPAVLSLLSNKK